ncbi:146_t:CDS:2 [Diversispora eburnea]|uniref:146_t:CDS:1 n=1 Tax=Diversispora eburnea TaxID=1213867 RepID=A0A9N9C6B9_9GLOM|nr:146_t:CDS:2 [Diversispora eburnea]
MSKIDELEIDEFEMDESEITKIEDILIDEGIEMIIHEFRDSDDETDEDEELSLSFPITITEAIDALKKVISYQENEQYEKENYKINDIQSDQINNSNQSDTERSIEWNQEIENIIFDNTNCMSLDMKNDPINIYNFSNTNSNNKQLQYM